MALQAGEGVAVATESPAKRQKSESATVVAPVPVQASGSLPPASARGARSYRHLDVAEAFAVRSSGKRNRTGAMIWEVTRDRTPINFHHVAVGEEADKWSEVIWDVKTEADDGKPLDRLGLVFRPSPQQVNFVQAVDARLIDQVAEKSMEVMGKVTKRDIVENMYQSPLILKEGHDPAVRMALTVRGHPAFLTKVHYYRALPAGGWEATPSVTACGWDQLAPYIADHRCRFTKVRGTFRVGGLQVIGGKSITIRWELVELHMREPPSGGSAQGFGISADELQLMQGLE